VKIWQIAERGLELSANPNGEFRMSDIVIIDTDILIDSARKINEAILCIRIIEDQLPLAISIITQMELVIGCRNKKELDALDKFLSRFEILKLHGDISDKAIELLRKYRLSHGLLIADALIAATALVHNQPLITKNQNDYKFIKNLDLLPYPNPFQ
jgi:predicted nucleic acid-binding protein